VATAYISTFRVIALFCGGLALLSGMVAWTTLGSLSIRSDAEPTRSDE
jgi:hypothetical protein